ncbi:MAG TPA: zf-HC2 domain-containing protein [Armatimonadota bacterium]|nr:zf-HC2 domain-containing protein [Armatimonadota bacterium]
MDCKAFSKRIGDYVNRALSVDAADEARVHLSGCPSCAALVKELESASVMVRSLRRVSAPTGFEQRVKDRRLAALKTQGTVPTETGRIRKWLNAIGRAFAAAPAHHRRLALRPALVGLLLCAVIAGSVLFFGQGRYSERADTDWGYIETCQEQHASFVSANPLADESAVILRERARDLDNGL